MREVTSITLLMVSAPTELCQTKCEVLLEGSKTGILVPGCVLEAAVQIEETRYVLFMTDEVIFEESLTIALIDIHTGIKEILWVGSAYSTGFFEDFSVTDAGIAFRFLAEPLWMLTVSPFPILRFPFFSDPKGVKRKWGLRIYMTLSELPN